VDKVVLSGLSAFRWASLLWIAAVLRVNWGQLRRPWLAVLLVGAAAVYTVVATGWLRRAPQRLQSPAVLTIEMALGVILMLCDGWAYGAGHAFTSSQSLGSYWPLAAVFSVGVAGGPWWGGAAGATLGVARVGAVLANGVRYFDGGRVLSLVNTTVFSAVAGLVAGYLVGLLRRAEREISAARAREEVARTLHDGVLQTLAVVERRSADPDLVRLAREQDRELRNYLFGDSSTGADIHDLGAALRRAAGRFESTHGVPVQVLVAEDLPRLRRYQVAAVSGAVAEALANVGKHAGASRVTVYVEPDGDDGLFCSVKDDGCGFDPHDRHPGVGLSGSIMGRMTDAGGRADIRSRAGSGTEVCLWL
jgi:signal transduction histidine kinase